MTITGTLINAGAVIIGSIIGIILHTKLPKKITTIVFHGVGLFTLFLGITMATRTGNFLIMIFSIVLGCIVGELIDIENYINRFSEYIKRKIQSKNDKFSEGLVTSFLLFCMGSMTILGAIEEGLGGKPDLLLAKSVLDGFSSIALAAALGIGVMFSVIPLLIYQGGLTIFAGFFENIFTEIIINELTAVGGILLIGLGLNILEIKKLKILNMLPGLLIAIILSYIFL